MEKNDSIYLDNTMASCFNTCPFRFYIRHVRHLVSIDSTPIALIFGSAIHSALEVLYLADLDKERDRTNLWEKVQAAFLDNFPEDNPGDNKRTRENGIQILEGYVKKWLPETFKVKAVELAGAIELASDCLFAYRMDLVVEYMGGIYMVEHKTTSNMNWLTPNPNHQISGYIFSGRVMGYDIDGAVLNMLMVYSPKTKIKLEDRYHRLITTRNEVQLDEWKHYILYTKHQIDGFIKSGWFPKYTHSCWNCTYKDLCNSSEKAFEHMASSLYKIERWEPWKQEV